MLEKLSPSLLNQLYGFLTNGNEDICLSTTRLRAENPEKATGSPIAFGMALLKINLLYRLPFLRNRKADASDGIPEKYRRRRVQDFISPAAGLHGACLDVFGSLLVCPLEETDLFALLERENGIRNFSKTRKKLDDPTLPLAAIYEKINEKLGCQADFHREEAWIFKLYTPNPYLKRAAEILHTCGLPLCAVAVTSLGSRQTAALLSANGIPADTLLCSSDLGLSKGKLLQKALPEGDIAALSCDFRGFLKPAMRRGAKPYYIPHRAFLRKRIRFPLPPCAFTEVYWHTLLTALLNRYEPHRAYELSFLYIGPIVYAAAYRLYQAHPDGPLSVGGLPDDFFPRYMEEVFGVPIMGSAEGENTVESYFSGALNGQKDAYVLLTDGEFSRAGALARQGVLDYGRAFHRSSRCTGIRSDELSACAVRLYQSAADSISHMMEGE